MRDRVAENVVFDPNDVAFINEAPPFLAHTDPSGWYVNRTFFKPFAGGERGGDKALQDFMTRRKAEFADRDY